MTKDQLRRIEADCKVKIEKANHDLAVARSRFVQANREFQDGDQVLLYSDLVGKKKGEKVLVGEGVVIGAHYLYNVEKKEGKIKYRVNKMKADRTASNWKWHPYEFNILKKIE